MPFQGLSRPGPAILTSLGALPVYSPLPAPSKPQEDGIYSGPWALAGSGTSHEEPGGKLKGGL